jgi:hypothetical protein
MVQPRKEDAGTETGETVEGKLMGCVAALMESAAKLRTALVRRDVETIWQALAEQEDKAGMLSEYATLWNEMNPAEGTDQTNPHGTERRHIRIQIKRLQALQRANSMLAQSFLSAVRKAVGSVAAQASGLPGGMYSHRGRPRPGTHASLVKRFG